MKKTQKPNNPLQMGNAVWQTLLSFFVLTVIWYAIILVGDIKPFILPAPHEIFNRFLNALSSGNLIYHFRITLTEVLLGLLIGVFSASLLGYLLAKSERLERIFTPIIVASQSIPTVAIAPLLIIWFGTGISSKVFICILIVFFPILINTIVGIRSVSSDLHDLMRSLNATKWQTFRLLELPAALPVVFGGLKIGATLSVIGAVVGEFVGADRGLGFLINVARGQYDIALVFVAVIALILMAMGIYFIVSLLEKLVINWDLADS